MCRTHLINLLYYDLLQSYLTSFSMKNLPQHRFGYALANFSSLALLNSFSRKAHDKGIYEIDSTFLKSPKQFHRFLNEKLVIRFLNKSYHYCFIFLLFFYQSVSAIGLPPKEGGVASQEKIESLNGVGVTEHLGSSLDLQQFFLDEVGKRVLLGDLFDQKRPIILSLVYYSCPGLCNYHLNGLTEAFKKLEWTIGNEFDVIIISFDSKERSDLANKKKESYLQLYNRPLLRNGWRFLTGSQDEIMKISEQVGFKFKWDEKSSRWIHNPVAYILTPDGKLSRYLYGVGFDAKTLRLSLVEASQGKIGNFVDQVLLFCFQYDTSKSRYTLYAYRIMQAGGTIFLLVLLGFFAPFWKRQLQNSKEVKGESK